MLTKLFGRARRTLLAYMGDDAMRVLMAPRYAGMGIVFMLHRVAPVGACSIYRDYAIPVDVLERCLRFVLDSGWKPIAIGEVPARLSSPAGSTERFACFTFDDGYADNLTLALPVFRKYNAPMCVYVATGLLHRTVFYWWGALERLVLENERVAVDLPGIPPDLPTATLPQKRAAYDLLDEWCHAHPAEISSLLPPILARYRIDQRALLDSDALTIDQTRELARNPLVTIGSHGISHSRFRLLSQPELDDEMVLSRRELQTLLDCPIDHFSYPFGGSDACGEREFRAAECAGYTTAVTTRRGNLFPGHAGHLLSLPRRGVRSDHRQFRQALFGVAALSRKEAVFVVE